MLRSHIPSAAKHKKMSKVDTLRHAVEYIQSLNRMLNRNSSILGDTESELDDLEDSEQDSTSIKMESPMSPPPEGATVPEHAQTSLMSQESAQTCYNYESGYETSSYYSSSTSLISPVPQSGYPLGYPTQSEVPQPQYFNYQQPLQAYNGHLSIEPNSEEDELLDAIANWQDS